MSIEALIGHEILQDCCDMHGRILEPWLREPARENSVRGIGRQWVFVEVLKDGFADPDSLCGIVKAHHGPR